MSHVCNYLLPIKGRATSTLYLVKLMRGIYAWALVLALLVPVAEAAEYLVTNTNNSGSGSLRQALEDSAGASGADTIRITATGTLFVRDSDLVVSNDVTVIGNPDFRLNGTELVPGNNRGVGLRVHSPNVVLEGLIVEKFGRMGISVGGTPTSNNVYVRKCTVTEIGNVSGYPANAAEKGIGVGQSADVSLENNVVYGNFTHGILVDGNATDTTVSGNLVYSNTGSGIQVAGTPLRIHIVDNTVGTDDGVTAKPNASGITIIGYPGHAGAITIEGNLVSGNNTDGIHIRDDALNVTLIKNFVGVKRSADEQLSMTGYDTYEPLPNGGNGVYLFQNSQAYIGTPNEEDSNVIAFNGECGVAINRRDDIPDTAAYVRRNAIFRNDRGGICYATPSQPTASSPFQSPTSITSVLPIQGSAPAGVTIVDIYLDNGEQGRYFVGSTDARTGAFSLNVGLDNLGIDYAASTTWNLTAVGTDGSRRSTEFSEPYPLDLYLEATPLTQSFPPEGGDREFSITDASDSNLPWAVSSTNCTWLTIETESGSGSGTFNVHTDANNTTSARSCQIQITSTEAVNTPITLSVTQEACSATLNVAPTVHAVGPDGGTVEFTVRNGGQGELDWNTAICGTGADFAHIIQGESGTVSGTDNGTVRIQVDANPSDNARTATICVSSPCGSQLAEVTINQSIEGCFLSVSPAGVQVSCCGTTSTRQGSFTIENRGVAAMTWNIDTSTRPNWLEFLSSTSGTLASGTLTTVQFQSTSNSGATRSADFSVRSDCPLDGSTSQTASVRITQLGPDPVLGVTPTDEQQVGSEGGEVSFTISNNGGGLLRWQANRITGTDFLRFSGATSGDLAGGESTTVAISVPANGGANDRFATVRIEDPNAENSPVDVIIRQVSSGATLRVTPTIQQNADRGGDIVQYQIDNAGSGTLSWTVNVIEGVDWLEIQSPSNGTGINDGTLVIAVAPLALSERRCGQIQIVDPDASDSPQTLIICQGNNLREVAQSLLNAGAGPLSFSDAQSLVPGLTASEFAEIDANSDGFITSDELTTIIEPPSGCNLGGSAVKGTLDSLERAWGDLFLAGLAIVTLIGLRAQKRKS